jgi:hypothetical protein
MADASSWLYRFGQGSARPRPWPRGLDVELGRLFDAAAGAQAVGKDDGVILPQLFVTGEGIDHVRALALPLGVLVPLEDAVG